MIYLTILAFIIILGLLVFVHELGHFVAAKLSGVKVEEFAFGFPPTLWSKRRGETKYMINLIPFGGYVKMLGEDEAADSSRSFSKKKPRVKFVIVVAGVIMNFILAGVLFSIGYMIGMSPIRVNPDTLGGKHVNQVIIAQVNADSPASTADLQVGDVVVGFDSGQQFVDFTKSKINKDVILQIKRKNENIDKSVHISANIDAPLGVGIVDVATVKLGFFSAIYTGFKDMVLTIGYIFVALWQFLGGLFIRGKIAEDVAGPVGMFKITGEAVKLGIVYVIQLTAILSINLGLLNILPFPALDGGRAVFIVSEGIFRKKIVKQEIENFLHMLGFILLILFVLAITYKEVVAML